MITRAFAGLTALVLVTACAGVEPAGRSSGGSESAPASQQLSPPPAEAAAPDVASEVRVTPEPRPQPRSSDDEVIVQGQVDRQVPPPEGDPRSTAERVRDVRAWDQCVSRAQAAGETDPMRPAMETPEELCARALGMADRFAVPVSRRE